MSVLYSRMPNTRFYLLAVSCWLAVAAFCPARAETTGGALLSWCSGKDQGLLMCVGYLRAVSEATRDPELRSCAENVPTAKMSDATVKFLNENRDLLSKPAALLAATALNRSFPCHNTD